MLRDHLVLKILSFRFSLVFPLKKKKIKGQSRIMFYFYFFRVLHVLLWTCKHFKHIYRATHGTPIIFCRNALLSTPNHNFLSRAGSTILGALGKILK